MQISGQNTRESEEAAGRRVDRCGAICLRVERGGALTVLLITSRETGRWGIPQGDLLRKEKPYRCAQRLALEEAGIAGKVRRRPIGHYPWRTDREGARTMAVHLLRLESEAGNAPEYAERQRIWVSPADAALLVDEPELRALFRSIEANNPLTSQDRPKPQPAGAEHPATGASGSGACAH